MSFFDDWWSSTKGGAILLYEDLKALANPIVSAAMVPIDKFKATAAEWLAQYNELLEIPDSELTPELLKEKRALVSRGQSIVSKIETLGLGVDALNGRLGFVPVVAGGVIAVAAGLMMYWTIDYIKFKDKLSAYKAMREKGASHKDAINVIKSSDSSPLLNSAENIAKYVALGGAAYFAYKLAKQYRLLK